MSVLVLIHTAALARWRSATRNRRNRFSGFWFALQNCREEETVETVLYISQPNITTGLKATV
ncbi:MAG TPA: hypothetical protein DCK93_04695 [Blastocatellia bacterium]|nr:hypothetical protein [Blastocatellia bacterium]